MSLINNLIITRNMYELLEKDKFLDDIRFNNLNIIIRNIYNHDFQYYRSLGLLTALIN